MSRAPQAIAVFLVVAASLWAWAISSVPNEPFATDSAVLMSIGLLMFSLIAAVGLLLPRGRWARNLARAVLGAEVLLAMVVPMGGWALTALIATGLGILGIQGKWLDGWLRRLPAADGPGVKPILFILGSLALVPALGAASPDGVVFQQGMLGAAGIIVAWGYSKAKMWALWAGRFLFAPLTVLAAVAASLAGASLLVVLGFGLVWLAWSGEVRLTINPLLDSLPGPRQFRKTEEATE